MVRKPIYGCNKDLARTTVNGKRVYLGEYNSQESKAAFDEIMADWEAAHVERGPTVDVALTVSRLAFLFLKYADKEYRRDGVPTGETANIRHALQTMNNLYHGVRVIDFGPQGQQVLNGIREMSRSDFVFDPQVGFEEYVRRAFGDKAKARKVGTCYTRSKRPAVWIMWTAWEFVR